MSAPRQGLRSRKPKSPDPPPISNAERCRLYKESIRQDPVAYEGWKDKKRLYNQKYKDKLKQQTPDEAALLREKNRIRQQQRRARLKTEKSKEKKAMPPPPRSASSKKGIQTREQALKEQEKRENARLRQQKRRKDMHPQKKRRENEKRMEYYYLKKASSSTPVVPATSDNRRKSKVRLSTLLNGVFNRLKRVRTKLGLHKLDLVKRLISRDVCRHEVSKAYYKRLNHQFRNNKIVDHFLEKNSIDFPGQKGSSKPKKVLTKTMATLFMNFNPFPPKGTARFLK